MKISGGVVKNETVGNPLGLRAWLRVVDALGELKEVQGAAWNLEPALLWFPGRLQIELTV